MKIGAKPFIGERVILINATTVLSDLKSVEHHYLFNALPKRASCIVSKYDSPNLLYSTVWSHDSFEEITPHDDFLPEYEVAMYDSGEGDDYRSGLVLSGQSWIEDDLTRFRMPGSLLDMLLNIEESNRRPA